jgi:dTDP-4-amino-4,6-dideoxygalactose transaminase
MKKPVLSETPPSYPSRNASRLHAAIDRLQTKEWTRLEGAPDTEQALKEFHGGGEVWYLSSGTAALQAILLGHGIGPGDEVITVPYTWGATVAAILAIGAIPVFADIQGEVPVMCPESAAACITSRTKAILCVHLFGFPCDMPRLKAVADQHGVLLFEDGSQAHGSKLHGFRVGRGGHGSAFSCMGLKPLAGTEGGYAIFESAEAAEAAYLHGKHPRGLEAGQAERLSEAGLLDALQLGWRPCATGAELVRSGLETLDAENRGRRENANHLRNRIDSIPGIFLDTPIEGSESVYHLVSIRIDRSQIDLSPSEWVNRLAPLGVSAFHYIPTPLHQLPRMHWQDYSGPPVFWHAQLERAGVEYRSQSCPHAEERCRSSFEMAWNWTESNADAMDQIADCLEFVIRKG